MSIKTPGSGKADSFQTSQGGLSGGFVKNDATGLLLYDQAGGTGQAVWEPIESKLVTVAGATLTFSGLNGDVDETYKLMYNFNFIPTGSNERFRLAPNGIVSAVTQFSLFCHFKNAGSNNPAVFSYPDMSFASQQNASINGVVYFNAKTGQARTMLGEQTSYRADLGRVIRNDTYAHWTDTVTNVTSLVIDTLLAGTGISVGSEWTLYKIAR
jgi:hypothetical protein